MKKKLLLLFCILFFKLAGKGQQPDELLGRWSKKSPIEKTWLHFDRDNYLAGETAWFKAYLYSDYQPDTISTSLYVELYNQSMKIPDFHILTNGNSFYFFLLFQHKLNALQFGLFLYLVPQQLFWR